MWRVPETVVFLHGFSGTRRAWDRVIAQLDHERYLPLTPDLPGHGQAADGERTITFAGCVEAVLSSSPPRFALCGYSMGGRVALHVALAAPTRVTRLLLIGATAGIEDERERAERRDSDHLLADALERLPFEDFIERWRTQPLFAADPPHVGMLARADQRRNSPHALAAALRGIGSGEMTPLWSRLGELTMPVTLLNGERDSKFIDIGRRMAEMLPNARAIVVAGGHGLPLENPDAVVAALDERQG
jgi:2-succinyl-6-hydroxy-2,4-cyclohexadiene-1-carboxylate synthase